ncbi:hypothetical protein BDM02DRAFT_3189890 [Thelephora ganbajun]|uniref:Uncharacterized protein n=1 Tax=Thelephora ganbajun TaxID=370292 RepID=A0ACB6Z7A1_THEGA|nr:hypothetical protein BDM02DRAFT_3189890 [Thelephora ganbajun]
MEWSSERRNLLEIRVPKAQRFHGPTSPGLPELPTPQREGLKLIDQSRGYEYTLKTHIVPAAWPRSAPDVGYPAGSGVGGLQDRGEFLRVREEMIEVKEKYLRGELPEGRDERQYWVCVNRYVRNRLEEECEGRKRLTLFLTHGIGFGKECWEPVLLHLLSNLREEDPIVDEIWSWDAANHGDSALLNKENLSSLYDWSDNVRDITNFLLNYLPDSAELHSILPTHLQRMPGKISETRTKNGFSHRTVVGIGHSFGGGSLALAVINNPMLFSSLVLVDPVVLPPPPPGRVRSWTEAFQIFPSLNDFVDGALTRRSTWKSKTHALEMLKKIPWFAAWDPLALEIYVDCQMYDDKSTGETKLKTTGIWEGATFMEVHVPFEVWDRIGELDQRVRLHYIQPEYCTLPGMADSRPHMTWLRPKNASNVVLPGQGHLVSTFSETFEVFHTNAVRLKLCQEVPEKLGHELLWFFRSEYGCLKSRL